MSEHERTIDYTHEALNREVTAIGGHYALFKEGQLAAENRKVLYLLGYGVFDTTCCGTGGCVYALVPGFILNWKYRNDENGRAVTEIEPIRNEAMRKQVRQHIISAETVHQVQFYS